MRSQDRREYLHHRCGTEPLLFTTSVDERKYDKLSTAHSVSVGVFSLR